MSPQLSVSPNPKVPFEIIYQDEDFVAVHKPAGIVTQPGIKNQYNTLLNGAFAHWGATNVTHIAEKWPMKPCPQRAL